MLSKQLLNERLIEQYNNAKLTGASLLSPRNGFYFIVDVNYKEFERNRKKIKVPVATALWKENEQESFIKEVSFDLALSALAIGDPLDYLNLVNKTVRIYDVNLIKDNDAIAMRIKCNYSVLTQRPTFTTILSHILSLHTGDASTLMEAYRKMENELWIDYSDPIQSQASNDAYDAPDQ